MLKRVAILLICAAWLVACDNSSPVQPTSPSQPPVPATATVAAPATATPARAEPTSTASIPATSVAVPSSSPISSTASVPVGGLGREAITVDGVPVVAISLAPNGAVYAATSKGFYLRNGDDNQAAADWDWQQVSNRAGLTNLVALDNDVLLAGGKPPCASEQKSIPLLRSADGGRTWKESGIFARPVETLSDDVFAIGCEGIYRSTDNGESWQLQPDLKAANGEISDLTTTADGKSLYFVAVSEGGSSALYYAPSKIDRWQTPTLVASSWGGGFVRLGPPEATIYFGSPLGLLYAEGAQWQADNAGLDAVRLVGDPRTAALSAADQAKMQRGTLTDLTTYQQGLLLATADGIYRDSNTDDPGWQPFTLQGTAVKRIYGVTSAGLYLQTVAGAMLIRLGN